MEYAVSSFCPPPLAVFGLFISILLGIWKDTKVYIIDLIGLTRHVIILVYP